MTFVFYLNKHAIYLFNFTVNFVQAIEYNVMHFIIYIYFENTVPLG